LSTDSHDLIIRVGGEGGEGIISTGDIITQAAARSGLQIFTFKTFPAEIKGGYAMYQVRLSGDPITSQGDGFNIFISFNEEAYQINKNLLKEGTVFMYDGPGGGFEPEIPPGVISYPVPLSQIAKEDLGSYRTKNMVAVGAITKLFGLSQKSVEEIVTNKFKKKGDEIVDINIRAMHAGISYVEKELEKKDSFKVASLEKQKDTIVLDGNEAIGFGALVAGCRFLSCYPITPATEVAIWLSKFLPKVNGTLVQAEDEIASIGNVLGAAYAGKKAMTSTSGPGMALMSELLGMATMAEIPCVIVNVQRGGPSTGLPTKHEQSDLFISVYGGHGDASRIVLACDDVTDCFYLTIEAFNLAEKYQIPVILLSDGALGMRKEAIKRPDLSKIKIVDREKYDPESRGDKPFLRYILNESNVSPMSIPGQEGGAYVATGIEHGEKGAPKYTPENHIMMSKKRFEKMKNVEDDLPETKRIGDDPADLGIISWGSTHGPTKEAIARARNQGLKVAGLFPKMIMPLPEKAISKFAKSVKKIMVPEINYQGQFAELIRSKMGIESVKYNIYGGLPFTPLEILNKIEEII